MTRHHQAHKVSGKSIWHRLDHWATLLARSIALVAVFYFGLHLVSAFGRAHMTELLLVLGLFAGFMIVTALVDLLTRRH